VNERFVAVSTVTGSRIAEPRHDFSVPAIVQQTIQYKTRNEIKCNAMR